jgi:hypothetical protein
MSVDTAIEYHNRVGGMTHKTEDINGGILNAFASYTVNHCNAAAKNLANPAAIPTAYISKLHILIHRITL